MLAHPKQISFCTFYTMWQNTNHIEVSSSSVQLVRITLSVALCINFLSLVSQPLSNKSFCAQRLIYVKFTFFILIAQCLPRFSYPFSVLNLSQEWAFNSTVSTQFGVFNLRQPQHDTLTCSHMPSLEI